MASADNSKFKTQNLKLRFAQAFLLLKGLLNSSLFTLHSSLPPIQLLQFFAEPLPVEHTCEGEAEWEGEPDAKDAKVGNEAKDIA